VKPFCGTTPKSQCKVVPVSMIFPGSFQHLVYDKLNGKFPTLALNARCEDVLNRKLKFSFRNHGFNSAAQPTVVEPGFRRNETFAQYIDNTVHWTDQEKAELQKELHYGPHITACPTAILPGAKPEPNPEENQIETGPKMPELASYPDVPSYTAPGDGCPKSLPVM